MALVRIVLAVDQALFAEAIRTSFASQPTLRIEAQVSDEIAAALALRSLFTRKDLSPDDRIVLITLTSSDDELPAVCARLIIEFPELLVIGIHAVSGKTFSYRARIEIKQLHGSIENLVEELTSLVVRASSESAVAPSP